MKAFKKTEKTADQFKGLSSAYKPSAHMSESEREACKGSAPGDPLPTAGPAKKGKPAKKG